MAGDPNQTADATYPPISRLQMDILDRLEMYPREYAQRLSLPLHPETPGIIHGLLLLDVEDAIKTIRGLRQEIADMIAYRRNEIEAEREWRENQREQARWEAYHGLGRHGT